MTKDLYTAPEVKKVKIDLLEEQKRKDLLTGLPLEQKDSVCDHNHKTLYVRGALHRQSNAVLGKIENTWTRYLSYWYEGTLSDFLRKSADYLERPDDKRWRHPHWLKKVITTFNKLNEKQKDKVISTLGGKVCYNATQRKAEFARLTKNRELGYDVIVQTINQAKE